MQLRDLRLLDPALATSYPSAILARDSALVVNLEFIKCIITTDYVLVLNPGGANLPLVGRAGDEIVSDARDTDPVAALIGLVKHDAQPACTASYGRFSHLNHAPGCLAEDEHSVTFIEEMQRRLAQQAAPDAKGGRMTSSHSSPNLTTQVETLSVCWRSASDINPSVEYGDDPAFVLRC